MSKHYRRDRWILQPPTVGVVCACVAAVLYAATVLLSEDSSVRTLSALGYRLARVLSLNEDLPRPGELGGWLDAMRIVAHLLSVLAMAMLGFQLFRALGGTAYETFRVRVRRLIPAKRVLVVGSGPASHAVVEGLLELAAESGRRTLVTHLRADSDTGDALHPLGPLLVLHVASVDQAALRHADAVRMDEIILVDEADAVNIELLAKCRAVLGDGPKRPKVAVRIDSPECARHLQNAPVVVSSGISVFCPDVTAAHQALGLAGHALNRGQLGIVAIGFGESASGFVAELLRQQRMRAGRIMIIDPGAGRNWDRFCTNFPELAAGLDPTLANDGFDSSALRRELTTLLAGGACEIAVSVSIGDVDRNISIGLLAASILADLGCDNSRATVWVRQSMLHDVGCLLHSETGRGPAIRVWGGLEQSFGVAALREVHGAPSQRV